MPTVSINVIAYHTKTQEKLLAMLNDKAVHKHINTIIKDAINPFVPMKSGKLRRSAVVTDQSISWGRGLPYARYQYGGIVYAPNFPMTRGGEIVGWYTPKGMKKIPTDRELGTPGQWKGWKFGYTTPNTRHHWDSAFDLSVKQAANLEITKYLKQECKNRGLKTT